MNAPPPPHTHSKAALLHLPSRKKKKKTLSLIMSFALRSAAPLRASPATVRPSRKVAAAPARALAGDGARVDRSKKTDVM